MVERYAVCGKIFSWEERNEPYTLHSHAFHILNHDLRHTLNAPQNLNNQRHNHKRHKKIPLNHNPPPPPSPPRKAEQHNRSRHTQSTPHSPIPVTCKSSTLSFTILICPSRVERTIRNAPYRSSTRRHHSHNAPVRGEVLCAPDHRDNDGDEGEGGAVAEAEEGRT